MASPSPATLSELNKMVETRCQQVGWLNCYKAVLELAVAHSNHLPSAFIEALQKLDFHA